tara:strand:- start:518 stop:634 length:117 start_codon:yes stop_codon:yes gene_type:complete
MSWLAEQQPPPEHALLWQLVTLPQQPPVHAFAQLLTSV